MGIRTGWGALLLGMATCAWADEGMESPAGAGAPGAAIPVATAAEAPDTAPETSAPAANPLAEEIVVTAQKREERLQDVPIAIQAFSGDNLAARGLDNTEALGQVVPSLQFTSVAGFSLVFIRGLGTDNFIPSADPSIATYIDGIYIPQGADTKNSLGNVKRVEVLKGPQGTLFGRNSTGGAISIVTEDPGAEWSSQLEAVVGNLDAKSAKVSLSGPVTSWLSVGVDGNYSHRDSAYDDPFFATQADRLAAVRARLLFHAGDNLRLSLTGYYSDQKGLGSIIGKNTDPSLLGTAAGITPLKDDFHAQTDYESGSAASQSVNYAVMTWQTPAMDVKLLGSYQYLLTRHSDIDFDGSSMPLSSFSGPHIYTRLRTGEVQLVSNADSWLADRLRWVAGLYDLHSKAGVDPAYFRGAPNLISGIFEQIGAPGVSQAGETLQNLFDAFGLSATPFGDQGISLAFRGVLGTRSTSAYAQGTWTFLDWVDLTLGGRYQHEKRYLTKAETDLTSFDESATPTVLPFALDSRTESNFSPKAVLSVRPFDDTMFYASYAVGFKSGTFNIVNLYTPPNYIEPERVRTFEVGAKVEFLDGRLRMNAAAFHNGIKDLQSGFVSLLSGGAVRFITVPKARSRGVELDGTFIPLPRLDPGLALTGNAAYVDARYVDFDPCPGFDSGTGVYSASLDCSHDRIVRTPRWSGGMGLVQTLDFGDERFEFAVDEYLNSGFYYDPYNTVKEKPYGLLDLRAAGTHVPWGLTVAAFCQNVLDHRYHITQFQTDFGIVKTLAPPRTFGLRLDWMF